MALAARIASLVVVPVLGLVLVKSPGDSHKLVVPKSAPPRLKVPKVVEPAPVESHSLDVKPLRSRPKSSSPRLNVPSLPNLGLDDPDAAENPEEESID